MSEKIILVSADSHVGGRREDYLPYMDELGRKHFHEYVEDDTRYLNAMKMFESERGSFRPALLPLVDPENIYHEGLEGVWDPVRRLKEMDREGVAAELMVMGPHNTSHPFFTPGTRSAPLDLRASGLRAFHRWLYDFSSGSDGRLIPVGDVAGVDIDATVAETRWCAEHGFAGVQIPGLCLDPELPPLFDAYYEPFWAVCAETGLRPIIHAGWRSARQGDFLRSLEEGFASVGSDNMTERKQAQRMGKTQEENLSAEGVARLALWQLMIGGVFDRYPTLNVVLIEVRADWVPATFKAFDARYDAGGTPLRMRPTAYFARNTYVVPSCPRRSEVELRAEIGIDRFLFGRDYPHPEGTWPNTKEWINDAWAGVPESEARLMLGENAIKCFNLDRGKLAQIAARIGPTPEDLLGAHAVNPQLLKHFAVRSGYDLPACEVNVGWLNRAMDQDLKDAARAKAP